MIRVLLVAAVLFASRPADACSKAHQSPFELFEDADAVAIVKVGAVPAKGFGPVALHVTRMLKGDPKTTDLVAQETNTSCHTGFRTGRTALVFLRKDGHPTGAYEGYREAFTGWDTTLDTWHAAKDADARLAVLLDAITGTSAELAEEAAYFLMDRPELIVRIDAAQRAQLLAAAKQAPKRSPLPLVLARLREPAALDRPSMYRDIVQRLLAASLEAESDPNKLADLIEHGPQREIAMERCERIRGVKLYEFRSYSHGVAEQFWPTLAGACRTGTPVAR